MTPELSPAIFIDRDGVLIENRPDYVKSWAEVVMYPDAFQALADVRLSGYKIVVVTNQAAIAKGLTSLGEVNSIHQKIQLAVNSAGGRIDAFYICPHQPLDNCLCRKPKPGLLIQASQDMAIELSKSILIGDALTDIQAGKAAGLPACILLLSGRGRGEVVLPSAQAFKPFYVFDDLKQAVSNIISGKVT
jgi:D-glycero-D-manno-heptose 1,7-bisphosphate phosphatase